MLRWVGVAVGVSSLTLTGAAYAQTPPAASTTSAVSTTGAVSTTSAVTPAAVPGPASASEPSPSVTEPAAVAPADASVAGNVSLTGATAETSGTSSVAQGSALAGTGVELTGAAPSSSQSPVVEGFGNAYNFSGPGRVLGIKGGSLAGTGHGYQMSWHKTGLLFSGNTWIDTGYRKSTNQVLNDEKKFVQEGRVLLRMTPMYTYDKWFVKAQAELLAHAKFAVQNPYIDTDDAWFALGYRDLFDIQVGRYEAWEVYHKGLGLERDTLEDVGAQGGDDIYEVNNVFYRESNFGQAALHVYPFEWLRAEVNSVLGYQGGDGALGIRPALIVDLGFLKVKAAYENKEQKPTQEDPANKRRTLSFGGGGSIQGVIEPYVELGANAAYGRSKRRNELGELKPVDNVETLSYGGFLNFNVGSVAPVLDGLVIGGGGNLTTRYNKSCIAAPQLDAAGQQLALLQPDGSVILLFEDEVCGSNWHNQIYGAVQYSLFDHALVKVVVGKADVEMVHGPDEAFVDQTNSMWNARLRFLVWY